MMKGKVEIEMAITMDNILEATFGEVASEIRATYKKTVLVKQYETEVIEMATTLQLEKPVTGAERMFISALLQVQLEYTAYCQLLYKGLVTDTEFRNRKAQLESSSNAIKKKAEAVTKRSMDEYISVNLN